MVSEELLLFRIKQQCLSDLLVLVVCHDVAGRVVAKEVIHGGRHLKRALVAVFTHPGNPLWVEDAAAEDTVELLLEGADAHFFRVCRIAVVGDWSLPAQFGNGGVESALKLEVIV